MQTLTPRARYTLALLTTIYALGYADRGVINLLLDDIKAEFSLSDTVLGLITGFGFTLTQVALGIPIARLADRARRMDILTAGLVLWSAATALCGRVSSAWQLAFARMTVGLGEACLVAPSHSLLSDLVPRERRTRAFGVLASGGDLGLILALLVGGWVQHYWGWRAAFLVAGLPGIAVAVLFRLIVKEPARPASHGSDAAPLGATLRFLGAQRAYVCAVLGGMAIGLTLFPLQVWAPALLRRVHHMSDREVGSYVALARVVALTGVVLGGLAADRLEQRGIEWRLRAPALACMLVAPFVLVFAFAGTPALALVALSLSTFAIGAHQAAVFSTCQTVAMPHMRALAAAIFMFSAAIVGSGVGTLLVGAASDALLPHFGNLSLRYALLMCVATSLCGAALFWYGGRYVQVDAERAERGELEPARFGSGNAPGASTLKLGIGWTGQQRSRFMMQRDTLSGIFGGENVTDDERILDEYSKDVSFVSPLRPAYVVRPRNADDVMQLVRRANETLTPLVPVSSGAPHFRGDTVPGSGGAVVVDLSGMKKILRVDRYHRVAMCEPGVTFEELIPAAEKEGIRLNLPLLPRKSKSVVGSLLEREPVIMPGYQWDISDPLACLGLIVGSGDEFRTGQAAGPGTIEEQWAAGAVQKAPYGPGSTCWHRLFQGAQGTMGIATWASMRCELLPSLEEPFMVGAAGCDKLFELCRWLIRLRLVNECFILNSANLATIMAKNWPSDYQAIKRSLPPWVLFYNLAGYEYFPEERVSYRKKNIQSLTQRIGVEPTKSLAGVSANELLRKVHRPSDEPYWKLRYKGACHDVFFLSITGKIESLIEVVNREATRAGYPASDVGVYIQPGVQGSSFHCEFSLFFDPESPGEAQQVRRLAGAATLSLMDRGAFFSRPYGSNARDILNRDAATNAALIKVKSIFDPNNLLNPGKLCF